MKLRPDFFPAWRTGRRNLAQTADVAGKASGLQLQAGVSRRRISAFTLAEALAALAFLAIVLPVAIEALHIANKAGVVAQRKIAAARFADRRLNELLVTGQWKRGANSGTEQDGNQNYRWQLRTEAWEKDSLKRLTLSVTYGAQGQEYEVQLCTVVDPNAP